MSCLPAYSCIAEHCKSFSLSLPCSLLYPSEFSDSPPSPSHPLSLPIPRHHPLCLPHFNTPQALFLSTNTAKHNQTSSVQHFPCPQKPKMPTELSISETTRRPPLSAAPTLTKTEGVPPQEQEHLPCPRCDSTNTKFCYYNNYNFSQPRHFCKSCRRYWTHGGTLRDIPIGGGTRRNAKRSRTSAITAAYFVGPDNNIDDLPLPSTPVLVPLTASQGFPVHFGGGGDGKGSGGCGTGALGGSFTSLLSAPGPAGILTLGRFGHGHGHVLEDMECGLGRGLWSFPGIGDGGAGVGGHVGVTVTAGLDNTWQFESGAENCFVGGDCFSWPELAISTPANGFK